MSEPLPLAGIGVPEAAALAGVSYRIADYWKRCGYIRGEMRGSGNPVFLSAAEASVLCVMAQLHAVGLEVKASAQAARAVVEDGAELVYLGDGVGLLVLNRAEIDG